jgi:hypothetical protein
MTVQRRFNQSLQFTQIGFSAMYSIAGFFVLLINQHDMSMLAGQFLALVLLWAIVNYIIRWLAHYWFNHFGQGEQALQSTRVRLWVVGVGFGMISILLAWVNCLNMIR